MIRKEDIEKLAALARVRVVPEEAETLAKDVEAILAYVSKLPESPDAHFREYLRNVMREDGEPHAGGVHTEKLLAAAPRREGEYVEVKPVLHK